MTSGFKTADGKDLDDLFYIDNGNAGALGFLYAGGADLGNAYTNKSVLGYNVGFLNKDGTDLGFLRGNITLPELTNISVVSGAITLERVNRGYSDEGEDIYYYLQIQPTFDLTFTENVESIVVVPYVSAPIETGKPSNNDGNFAPSTFAANLKSNYATTYALKLVDDYYTTTTNKTLYPDSSSFRLYLQICSRENKAYLNYTVSYNAFFDFIVTGAAGTNTIRSSTYTYTYTYVEQPDQG